MPKDNNRNQQLSIFGYHIDRQTFNWMGATGFTTSLLFAGCTGFSAAGLSATSACAFLLLKANWSDIRNRLLGEEGEFARAIENSQAIKASLRELAERGVDLEKSIPSKFKDPAGAIITCPVVIPGSSTIYDYETVRSPIRQMLHTLWCPYLPSPCGNPAIFNKDYDWQQYQLEEWINEQLELLKDVENPSAQDVDIKITF